MHQSIMRKIKNYAYEDWIVLDVNIKSKTSIKKMEITSNFIQAKTLCLENISNNF